MGERKFYLTESGLEKLKKEYRELQKLRRSKSKSESPRFLHSEEINPEYLAFQEDISFLEDRITNLKYILRNAEIIKAPPKEKQNTINLGALVLVQAGDGQVDEFNIVGSLEANPSFGKISDKSPAGKALLGHKIGDEVVINSAIKTIYKIKNIKYKTYKI